ncbi:hypothetical protein GYMLUDRAFT_97323 [Collybiopsis luxurians FD-317 M1]|uniref:Uncharacterized protein n=1 Tax=Collybiopsis luxurians FD-317 M1 TaxID=944289 RepID=A0A0D0B8Z9_9AGAR|nr:hypothetical protein GYMLUDRAFT_97323 [Collybiopsis luxurians FD-317 M1]
MSGPPPALPAGEILELKVITTDVLVEALWLGVQGVVTIMGIYVLWSRGLRKSIGNKFLVGIIMLLFCLSAVCLSLTIWVYMATYDELGGTFDATDISNKVTIITMVFQRLQYFISDSIVVWRAWLLWDRNIFVKMILLCCLLGTITATFVQGALSVDQQVRQSGGVAQGSGVRTLMFSLPLLITNLVSTILIGFKIWEYRRNIMAQISNSRTRVFNILLILLESSVLYCLCWILAMLGALGGILSPIATSAIMGSLPYVTSIYPIAIIILVTIDKDNYGSSISNNTTMRFNHPAVVSTMNGSGTRVPDSTYFTATKKSQSADFLSSSSEKL